MSETDNKTPFQMSDDLISMIRELIQLSLLTGTNLVDHLRAIQMEPTTDRPDRLTITPAYVMAYNEMIMKLNAEVETQRKAMQEAPAIED